MSVSGTAVLGHWSPKTSGILFLLDLALSGQILRTCIPDLYGLFDLFDLAHVAGWELHNLQYLGHLS